MIFWATALAVAAPGAVIKAGGALLSESSRAGSDSPSGEATRVSIAAFN